MRRNSTVRLKVDQFYSNEEIGLAGALGPTHHQFTDELSERINMTNMGKGLDSWQQMKFEGIFTQE